MLNTIAKRIYIKRNLDSDYYQSNEYKRLWALNNPEKVIKSKSDWDNKNRKEYQRIYMRKNLWKYRERIQAKRKEDRLIVLNHYSNNLLQCNCCNTKVIEFLAIDHINGGGSQHRKIHKGNIYRWLIKNNFPEGYQILCHNCNQAKGYYGECPHKIKEKQNA